MIDEPLQILNTNLAVYIGIVYSYLPFMVLPLYANLVKHDQSLLEAASDLGARNLTRFWQITVPLSKNGIIAGCMLVFIPVVGEFVIPEMLGGPETLMIGKVLWQEFFNNRDWPVASALAVVMLAVLIIPIILFNRNQAKELEGQGMRRFGFAKLMLWLGLLFIYLPMIIMVIYSFNASKLVTVWGGWSLKWYFGLLDNKQLIGSVFRSLRSPSTPPSRRWWRWGRWRPSC